MPRRNLIYVKALLPLGLLAVAAFALVRRGGDDWEYEQDEPVPEAAPPIGRPVGRGSAARFALVACFVTLFFAGASFTAGAGDQVARLLDDDAAALAELDDIAAGREAPEATAPADQPVEAAPAAEPAAAELAAPAEVAPEAVPEPEAPVAADGKNAAAEADAALAAAAPAAPSPDTAVAPVPVKVRTAAGISPLPTASAGAARPAAASAAPATSRPTKQWIVERAAAAPALPPEVESGLGEPTIWLNRALPDPTPASARLARSFARDLAAAAKGHGADWAVVLGVLRAQGERGSVPATAAELAVLAERLAGQTAFMGALAVSGRTSFADRAVALADLYRSVGIEALVSGFEAAKARLSEKLLANERLSIYDSGRNDIAAGRIDVRIIVLLGYLVERHESVTVSSLFSGHRKFARPGVVSAHVFGHAVDIAAVGGSSIAGNQEPGGLTEAAVRSVLLLPAELQPQQVISLLGLGGPSFPLRDHGDHIHVGF